MSGIIDLTGECDTSPTRPQQRAPLPPPIDEPIGVNVSVDVLDLSEEYHEEYQEVPHQLDWNDIAEQRAATSTFHALRSSAPPPTSSSSNKKSKKNATKDNKRKRSASKQKTAGKRKQQSQQAPGESTSSRRKKKAKIRNEGIRQDGSTGSPNARAQRGNNTHNNNNSSSMSPMNRRGNRAHATDTSPTQPDEAMMRPPNHRHDRMYQRGGRGPPQRYDKRMFPPGPPNGGRGGRHHHHQRPPPPHQRPPPPHFRQGGHHQGRMDMRRPHPNLTWRRQDNHHHNRAREPPTSNHGVEQQTSTSSRGSKAKAKQLEQDHGPPMNRQQGSDANDEAGSRATDRPRRERTKNRRKKRKRAGRRNDVAATKGHTDDKKSPAKCDPARLPQSDSIPVDDTIDSTEAILPKDSPVLENVPVKSPTLQESTAIDGKQGTSEVNKDASAGHVRSSDDVKAAKVTEVNKDASTGHVRSSDDVKAATVTEVNKDASAGHVRSSDDVKAATPTESTGPKEASDPKDAPEFGTIDTKMSAAEKPAKPNDVKVESVQQPVSNSGMHKSRVNEDFVTGRGETEKVKEALGLATGITGQIAEQGKRTTQQPPDVAEQSKDGTSLSPDLKPAVVDDSEVHVSNDVSKKSIEASLSGVDGSKQPGNVTEAGLRNKKGAAQPSPPMAKDLKHRNGARQSRQDGKRSVDSRDKQSAVDASTCGASESTSGATSKASLQPSSARVESSAPSRPSVEVIDVDKETSVDDGKKESVPIAKRHVKPASAGDDRPLPRQSSQPQKRAATTTTEFQSASGTPTLKEIIGGKSNGGMEASKTKRKSPSNTGANVKRQKPAPSQTERKSWQSTVIIVESSDEEDASAQKESPDVNFVKTAAAPHWPRKRKKPGRPPSSFKKYKYKYNKKGIERNLRETGHFNFNCSEEEAAREQERLFREAADRLRREAANEGSQVASDVGDLRDDHWKASDPYLRLGLAPGAPIQDVKRRYRRLVLKCHPDKGAADVHTTARFQAVTEAYKALCEQSKRLYY